jgi:hypothetical protein
MPHLQAALTQRLERLWTGDLVEQVEGGQQLVLPGRDLADHMAIEHLLVQRLPHLGSPYGIPIFTMLGYQYGIYIAIPIRDAVV